MLHEKQSSISHLRVLGCLCFTTNLIKHEKFEPRAMRSVLLGYVAHQKGYMLLDLEHRVFFISKDVVFYEDVFLFQSLDITSADFFLDSTPVPRHDVVIDSAPMAVHITHKELCTQSAPCSPTLPETSCSTDIAPFSIPDDASTVVDSTIDVPVSRCNPLILGQEIRKSRRVSKPPIWL